MPEKNIHLRFKLQEGAPINVSIVIYYKTSENHNRHTNELFFFNEVKQLADIGVKQFEFIDDIFKWNTEI